MLVLALLPLPLLGLQPVPVSGCGDARVAPPLPHHLCVWRNLPYLTLAGGSGRGHMYMYMSLNPISSQSLTVLIIYLAWARGISCACVFELHPP